MKAVLLWFFSRLAEPSSAAGLGLIGLAGQQAMAGDVSSALVAGLTGLVAFAKKEAK